MHVVCKTQSLQYPRTVGRTFKGFIACVYLRIMSTANIIWRRCEEQWWQKSATRRTDLLPETNIAGPLCPPQILHGLFRDRTLILHYDRPPTSRVIHVTDLQIAQLSINRYSLIQLTDTYIIWKLM